VLEAGSGKLKPKGHGAPLTLDQDFYLLKSSVIAAPGEKGLIRSRFVSFCRYAFLQELP
jgi:hypothetical protein